MIDSLPLKGRFFVKVYGPEGGLKSSHEGENVITTVGKEYLASFLQSASVAASTMTAKYMAIGSDSTAEAVGNTALGTELARTTGTVSYVSGAIYQVTATFAAGTGTGSIYEYGIFTSSTGGTLFSRDTEALVTKASGDTLIATWQLTLG